MPIKKGNTNIGAIYKGTTQIARVYKGTKLLFENAKWLDYLFEHIYHSLIPTQINGSKVQDKGRLTKIEGNGVIENQLVQELNSTNNSIGFWYGVHHTVSYSNNVATLTTTGSNSGIDFGTNATISFVQGHKYLAIFNIKSSVAGRKVRPQLSANQSGEDVTLGTNNFIAQIVNYSVASSTSRFAILIFNSETNDTFEVSDFMLLDLTLMFGTGNEPTSLTDNRIQAILNRGYIPYNTGSYKNSKVGEIECEPYNVFDGTIDKYGFYLLQGGGETTDTDCDITDFIEIIGGKAYTFEGVNPRHWSNPSVCYYDKNKNYLTGQKYNGNETTTFASPNNAHYVRFTVDKTSTQPCFHLTGTRTGYAPYQAPTKITLNGLLELNGAINSHDTFEITNTDYVFTRNAILLVLGNATWETNSTQGFYTLDYTSIVKANTQNYLINTSKYHKGTGQWTDQNSMWVGSSSAIGIADQDFSSGTDFKNYLTTNNIKMVCELATPQITTIPKKHLGCVDLGSLNWNRSTWEGVNFFYAVLSNSSGQSNMYCSPYPISNNKYVGGMTDKSTFITDRLYVRDDSITSAADFKTAMSGQYLFYETDAEVSDLDNVAQINAGDSISANEFSANFEQVIANGDFADTSAWSFSFGDSENTFTVNNNVASIKMYSYGDKTIFRQQYTPVSGHKYLLVADYRVTTLTQGFSWVLGSNSVDFLFATTSWQTLVNIGTRTDANPRFGISLSVSRSIEFRLRNVKYIDLTETFGAGNEPTSENDYRVQYILNGGSLDAVAETEVLPNVEMSIKCR